MSLFQKNRPKPVSKLQDAELWNELNELDAIPCRTDRKSTLSRAERRRRDRIQSKLRILDTSKSQNIMPTK